MTGLAVRLVRPLLRRGKGRGLPVPPYLALRRLGAARGLLVVLAVVSAVSFGAFFYAETLATSLKQTTDEKAYTANGSDVAALVQESEVMPRNFPYPITKIEFGHGSGAANTSIGAAARRARRRPAQAAVASCTGRAPGARTRRSCSRSSRPRRRRRCR